MLVIEMTGNERLETHLVVCGLGLDLTGKDILSIGELVLIHDMVLDCSAVPISRSVDRIS